MLAVVWMDPPRRIVPDAGVTSDCDVRYCNAR
jgi:hypothetical protein